MKGKELENSIQPVSATGGALSAEHYQTFEMAKANDDVIGGDNIAQIRSYAAFARAQAQAIHKSIATMGDMEDVAQAKAEMNETSQTFAKVSIYADQRIGELLRELPKAKNQYDPSLVTTVTKREAEQEAGISHKTAIDLQALAANPDVVELVIANAEIAGTIPSRAQVLKAIDAQKQAERNRKVAEMERDKAKSDLAEAYRTGELLESQIESLKKQAAAKPKPEIIEHEVKPKDYEEVKRRARELESGNRRYSDENTKLRRELEAARKELDQAKGMLGMNESTHEVRRDVQYLISATNQYIRQYGGLTWTVQQLEQLDEATLDEFKKAALNLATFANALASSLGEM